MEYLPVRYLLLNAISRWFRRNHETRLRQVIRIDSTDALPGHLKPAVAYLIGPPLSPRWLVLGCPCRCGEALWLNLMPDARPGWRIHGDLIRLSVSPSVDSTTCGSHFWLTHGRFEWV